MTDPEQPAVPTREKVAKALAWFREDPEKRIRWIKFPPMGLPGNPQDHATALVHAALAGAVPDTGQARELRVIHPRERDDMAAALHSAECDCGDRPHHERETGADYDQLATAAIKHARIASPVTVQAPDVAALPPEVVAVIEAARAWAANNHRAGHTPTGPSARLYDAVCALLGTARALLGTDTTTEETP